MLHFNRLDSTDVHPKAQDDHEVEHCRACRTNDFKVLRHTKIEMMLKWGCGLQTRKGIAR